jgi:hypothetical protein
MIFEPKETRGRPLERRKRWRSSASVVDVITATWANWPNSVPADTVRLVIPSRRSRRKKRPPFSPHSTLASTPYYTFILTYLFRDGRGGDRKRKAKASRGGGHTEKRKKRNLYNLFFFGRLEEASMMPKGNWKTNIASEREHWGRERMRSSFESCCCCRCVSIFFISITHYLDIDLLNGTDSRATMACVQ